MSEARPTPCFCWRALDGAIHASVSATPGPPAPRIPYGSERRYFARLPGYREQLAPADTPCHDCAVRVGELHVEGCDWEECETCGGQRIGCNCCVVCRAHEKDGTWCVCGTCIERARVSRGAPTPAMIAAAAQALYDVERSPYMLPAARVQDAEDYAGRLIVAEEVLRAALTAPECQCVARTVLHESFCPCAAVGRSEEPT